MTINKPIQSIRPIAPIRVINTIKPLKTVTPIQLLNYKQQGQSYSDPYAINSLTDVLFNRKAQIRKFGDYNAVTVLKAGVHHLSNSFIKPILKGDMVTAGVNSLISFSEDADVLANVAKGAIIEADNEVLSYITAGVVGLGAGALTIASGGTFGVALAAGAVAGGMSGVAASIVDDSEAALRGIEKGSGLGNYGKKQYDFDMGNFFLNMTGEVIMDPLNWLSFGSAAVIKNTTRIAREAGEAVAEQGVKLTMGNSALHLVEKLGAFDDVVTKTAFLTNPLGLSLYGIKTISSPLSSAILNKFAKSMADFTTKSDILDAMGYNEAISVGMRQARGFTSEVRKNYATELMVMPGKDANISQWYRVTTKTLSKVFGVEFSKASDMLDEMWTGYLKGDPDYMMKYVNDENKEFLESVFANLDVAGQTKFGAAKGYYTMNYKKGLDAVGAYIQRMNEGAKSRVLFDETMDRAFYETKKVINKNMPSKEPTVSEYLVGVRKGLYERFPELEGLPLDQAKRKYEMLFKQIELMYLQPMDLKIDDLFGTGSKLEDFDFASKAATKVAYTKEAFKNVMSDGNNVLLHNDVFKGIDDVEKARELLNTEDGLDEIEKWFTSEAVPGFEKELVWEEAKKVVRANLTAEHTGVWLDRFKSERFREFANKAFAVYKALNEGDKKAKALGDAKVMRYISANVVPEKVDYFKTILSAFAVVHAVAQKVFKNPEADIPQLDRFLQMYKVASSVNFSDLKQYITAGEDTAFYQMFSEINAIVADLGIIEDTAIHLNKEGSLLLQLNKRFQTEFMRNTILDSAAVLLFDSLVDTTQPLGMLMEMLANYKFADEFKDIADRAREVYTSIRGFENYVDLSTKLQLAVKRTVEYNPTQRVILNMRHAAWVVDDDPTRTVFRVLWDGESDTMTKHSEYYTFMKDEVKSDTKDVFDLDQLTLVTDEQFIEDMKELEALKAQFADVKKAFDSPIVGGRIQSLTPADLEIRLWEPARFQKQKLVMDMKNARSAELDDVFGAGFDHPTYVRDVFKYNPVDEPLAPLQYTHVSADGRRSFRTLHDFVFNTGTSQNGKTGLQFERLGMTKDDAFFNDLNTYFQFTRIEDTLGNTEYNPKSLAKMWVSFSRDFADKDIAYRTFLDKRLNRMYGLTFKATDVVVDDELYDEVTFHMLKHFSNTPEKMLTLSNYTDRELIEFMGIPEIAYNNYVKPAKDMVSAMFDGYSPAYVMKRIRDLDASEMDILLKGGTIDGIPTEFTDYLGSKLVQTKGLGDVVNAANLPPMVLNINKLISFANIHKLTVADIWKNISRLYNDNPNGYTVLLTNGRWSGFFGDPSGNYTFSRAEELTEKVTRFIHKITQDEQGAGGVRLPDGAFVDTLELDALRKADIENAKSIGSRKIKGTTVSNATGDTFANMRVLNHNAPFDNSADFSFNNIGYSSNKEVNKAFEQLRAMNLVNDDNFKMNDATAQRIYFDTMVDNSKPIVGFTARVGAPKEYEFLSTTYDMGKGQSVAINGVPFKNAEAAFQAMQVHNVPVSELGKYTPDRIEELAAHQIFVFGSDVQGVHDRGTALKAKTLFGAVEGQGRGLQGRSYGLPTSKFVESGARHTLTLDEISNEIDLFIKDASKPENRSKQFMMPKVGIGSPKVDPEDVAKLFRSKTFPKNVVLPYNFVDHPVEEATKFTQRVADTPKGYIPLNSEDAALVISEFDVQGWTPEINERLLNVQALMQDIKIKDPVEKPVSSVFFKPTSREAVDSLRKVEQRFNFREALMIARKVIGEDFDGYSRAQRNIHAQAVYSLLGDELHTPLKFFVYSAVDIEDRSLDVTLAIAKKYAIPTFDISDKNAYDRLIKSLEYAKEHPAVYSDVAATIVAKKEKTLWQMFASMDATQARQYAQDPYVKGLRVSAMDDKKSSAAYRLYAMQTAMDAKFKDPTLQQRLLATGTRPLENNNTYGDTFFGTMDGEGNNHLGLILEKKRSELLQKVSPAPRAVPGETVVPRNDYVKDIMDPKDLQLRAVLNDMTPQEYSILKRKADGYKFADGRVEVYKNQSVGNTPRVPATLMKGKRITDPKNQELLYGMVLEMLEEFRTKPVADAMELLANNGEKFYARFQLAPHLAAYEDVMRDLYVYLQDYLKKQELISDFNVKTIEMPTADIGFKIESLLDQYLPELVKGMNDEGMQQDMYSEAIQQLKEQFYRFNGAEVSGPYKTTSHKLADAPNKIKQMNQLAHRYFIRAQDETTAARATATLMSTGRLFGAIGLDKGASPYSGVIQRYVNTTKRNIIDLHPDLQPLLDNMDEPALRKYIYDYDPQNYENVMGEIIHDKYQAALNTQAVYENQLNLTGSLENIKDTINSKLMQTTGANVEIFTPLELYQTEHAKMFESGFLKFNPAVKDALYNYQIHGTEMLQNTKNVFNHLVMDPKGTGHMGTYAGYTQAAKNTLNVLTTLANADKPENVELLARLLKFGSVGDRVFIGKTLLPDFDPRVLSMLETIYGIKYVPRDMHFEFNMQGTTKLLDDLGPITGKIARVNSTEGMTPKFIEDMSAFYYKMQESSTRTFPLDWADSLIMRVDDAKMVPYLTDVLKYMSPEEGVAYASALQDSGMFGLSLLTDVDELSTVFSGKLMENPAKMAISSGVTLMLHHDAKPRFLNLFFNENFRLNNFFGTDDPKMIYDVMRQNPDLAIMGLNKDMNALQIPIKSVRDVELALKKDAIITTYRGFIKTYNALDTFKLPKFMDWIERNLTAPFKAGAMTSLGLPVRNMMDNMVKLMAYARGDWDVVSYIPKAYEYMGRFQEMALEMKNIQNPRSVAEYLLQQSPKDQEIFFLMVQAKETAVSGAPMDVYLDLSKAERMAAELRSGKTDPSSLIQRISWGNPVTQFALSLQNTTEQHWRLAAYLYDMNRGVSASETAHRVAEFFIDYSHKTPTMQYLNAIVPFSMFTVKNTLLWAEHALDTPWLLRTLIDASELTWRQSEEDQKSQPSDYERQQRMSGNIRLGNTLVKMNPSLYDAMMLIPGLIQNPLGRVNPVIKNTAALMRGDLDQIQLPWETQAARVAKAFKTVPGMFQGTEPIAATVVPSLFSEMKTYDRRGTEYRPSGRQIFNSVYYAAQMSRKRGGASSNRTRRNFYNNIWSASGKPRFASTTLQSRMNSISFNYRSINRRIY